MAGLLFFGSGCLEGQEDNNPKGKYTESETARTDTTELQKTSRTDSTELQEVGLSSEVSLVESATADSPAGISVSLTNESTEQQTYMLGGGRPISDFVGERKDGQGKIVLVPETLDDVSIQDQNDDGDLELIPESKQGDCWKTIDKLIIQDVLREVTLKPKETISERYRILSNEGCPSSGVYRFENELFHEEKEVSWTLYIDYPINRG